MLGGDNIDLALAHRVEKKLGGVRLDAEQWSALRYACRTAKEKLLGDLPAEPLAGDDRRPRVADHRRQHPVGADPRGGAGDRPRRLLPARRRGERPGRGAKVGLQEFGLPFVADPAIPRHLAAFLRRHKAEAIGQGGFIGDDRPARPDAILFNGGALTPDHRPRPGRRGRRAPGSPTTPAGRYAPRVLTNASLDLAVAHGAAYYGVVRRGGGIRIGGGTARSFYVGFQAESADKPWLCVVPRDAQEGDEIAIDHRDFDLLMGQPVAFPLASSSVRPDDRPGDLVAADPDSIRELPPLQGVMRVGRKAKAERVPVRLAAKVTEVGTVELWCQSRTDDRRWRLQIQLRGPSGTPTPRGPVDRRRGRPRSSSSSRSSTRRSRRSGRRSAPSAHRRRSTARRGWSSGWKRCLDVPRDQWPPSALRAFWEPLRDVGRAAVKSPAARVALVQPGRLLPPARDRLPARRDPDQGPLAGRSTRGSGTPRTCSAGPSGGSSGGGSRPG